MRNNRGMYEKAELIQKPKTPRISEEYGLCAKCNNLRMARTMYDSEYVTCINHYIKEMNARPSKSNRIKDCDFFYPRGHLSLGDMSDIATYIDIKKKPRAGFIKEKAEEIEIIFSPPNEEEDD